MKRRLAIAAGIIHDPKILFLDEPTTGIDVASARQLRRLIAELHRGGTTIFLTTHYIEEAERLCERIAFIVAGRIVQIDSVEHLLQPLQGQHVVQISSANEMPGLPDGLAAVFPEMSFTCPAPRVLRAEASEPVRVGAIVRFLEERGIEVAEARRIRLSLEDVFVRVTGIAADAMRKERQNAGGSR
jgi:ABC-2 type transport system ATP-binding protein